MKTEHAQRVYFEQLKRSVPIGAVLAKYGIKLTRRGASLKGCCPIHGGTNATQFAVDENKNLWRCFSPSCDRGGGILELVSELEHVSLRDAALLIADWFAIKPSSDVQRKQQQRSRTMSEGSKPTHKVYSAQKRGEGQKDFLTRIGSGWIFNTKDGRGGMNIQLSAMPMGERVVIFEYDEDETKEEIPEKKDTANVAKFKKK